MKIVRCQNGSSQEVGVASLESRLKVDENRYTCCYVSMEDPFLSVDIFFVNDLIISEFLKTELQGIIPELFQAFQ